jgi:hypothetical protein
MCVSTILSDTPRLLVSSELESNGMKRAGLYQPFVLVHGKRGNWFWNLPAASFMTDGLARTNELAYVGSWELIFAIF